MIEDDAPVRRVPLSTQFIDETTRPHRSAHTQSIPELDAPQRAVRGPTDRIDPPTRKIPSAPSCVSGTLESPDPFDRMAAAAGQIRIAGENLDVDRRPLAAQLLSGIAAGLQGSGQINGFVELVGARIVQRLILADAGVGGRFNEDHLGQELIVIATEILAGVDPNRRAARSLAAKSEVKAKQYRKLAESARASIPPDFTSASRWDERASEREDLAKDLRRESR